MTTAFERLIADCLAATKESKRIDFKGMCDLAAPGGWCELLKDVVAFANSGGGVIAFGLDDSGKPAGWNPKPVLDLDPADIDNQIFKYTGEHFDDYGVVEKTKGGRKLALLTVGARTGSPLVFIKPGTYQVSPGEQARAFSQGTVYFRHGAKSEPGTSKDIERFVAGEITRQRRDWLKNIRKISTAPSDAEVFVFSPQVGPSDRANRFRVVDDPSAPAAVRTDFDVTHPYRQKELIDIINKRLGKGTVTQYDIQCVRRVHGVDNIEKFFHKPKFGSPQYSDAFVSWLVSEHQRNSNFFEDAKSKDKAKSRK